MKTLSLKTFLLLSILAACFGGVAGAVVPPVHLMVESGAIKVWSSGETLTSADLNGNFQHIHNLMVGGHGARLVDADVSASANISSSKLAAYRGIPRAWVQVGDLDVGGANCTTGTCTLGAAYNVTSVVWQSTGLYKVTLAYTATNTNYLAQAGSVQASSDDPWCMVRSANTTTLFIQCRNASGVQDAKPNLIIFDND